MPQDPLSLAVIVFTLVMMAFSLSLHDAAQAWMANRLGDPTARMLGRLTLNPAKHFDLWGMAISPLLSLFVFHNHLPLAWSLPVPTTYRNFRSKNGEMLSVCAGPAAQFLAATVALILLLILKHTVAGGPESMVLARLIEAGAPVQSLQGLPTIFPLLLLLCLCIEVNLLLLCLNILPMPFLDGGRILVHFLPYNAARSFERYSMYFMIAFFLLAWPLISIVFSPLMSIFDSFILR